MSDKKRLFIGVKVCFEEKTEEFYSSIPDILHDAEIKWVGTENLHLTLKFLGDVEISAIDSIKSKMDMMSKKHNCIRAILKGVGVFKDFYHPKVLWIGLRNCPEFEGLKNDIENSVGDLGFEIDYRKFTPHLTIGRFKNPGNMHELKSFVSSNQETYFQQSEVSEIVLFESILKPEGPHYNILHKSKLGAEESFSEFRF
ncbi:MAG: RNA 2',3'-cyclic phosphodiesterase [Candidatus Delongbacteria bacterium]|nr:RNA 2',3'-cyclic phosphodiesterase [Candidatus Delongbacteria bacterium]